MLKKVLIVEDYADAKAMMKFFIKHQGYEVIKASDGYEAIKKVKEHHPDLILMDIAMPIINGVTSTEIIRDFYDTEKVPIIALTAYDELYQQKAIQADCNEVISKPIEFDKIEPLLKQYLH
ncbi:MAG TPA: response regulator [Pyrinomonadaceae bacterium]|jgi:CheY-like chemotaxis protein